MCFSNQTDMNKFYWTKRMFLFVFLLANFGFLAWKKDIWVNFQDADRWFHLSSMTWNQTQRTEKAPCRDPWQAGRRSLLGAFLLAGSEPVWVWQLRKQGTNLPGKDVFNGFFGQTKKDFTFISWCKSWKLSYFEVVSFQELCLCFV